MHLRIHAEWNLSASQTQHHSVGDRICSRAQPPHQQDVSLVISEHFDFATEVTSDLLAEASIPTHTHTHTQIHTHTHIDTQTHTAALLLLLFSPCFIFFRKSATIPIITIVEYPEVNFNHEKV